MLKLTKSIWRSFCGFMGKCFRSRNIIVVSEGEVNHYPVGSKLQFLGLVVVMGMLSWASYSTGSYLASQAILREKERKIETTTLANRQIEEQFTLLKRDLNKLQGKAGELDEYDRFVVEQHSMMADAIPPADENDLAREAELAHLGQNILQERINYLELMVDQLKQERGTLLSSLQQRTGDQITLFEDIIASTGLELNTLTKHADAKLKVKEIQTAAENFNEDESAQGGPYVPVIPPTSSEVEENLFKDVDQMLLLSDIVSVLPLARPIENARISSQFGRRVDPITKRWAIHKGMDFVGEYNSPVHATSDGVIDFAGRNGAYGYLVEVDHGYDIATRYAHLRKILVKKGQKVKKGDIIGLQGNSGRSTGSHLHYEVRFKRKAQNPKKFIEAGNYVLKK